MPGRKAEDIGRAARKRHSSEEKICIVLEEARLPVIVAYEASSATKD